MYKSAYETNPCRGHVMNKIKVELEKYYLNFGIGFDSQLMCLEHPRTGEQINNILVLKPGAADIPTFSHPFRIKPNDQEFIVIDARNFLRLKPNGEVLIYSGLDYGTLRNRAILEAAAGRNGTDCLLALSNIHVTVFTRWVADAIGRRLGLSPEVQIRLSILAGIYYLAQFMEDEVVELDEKQKVQMATKIGRSSYLNVEEILKVLDEVETFPANAYGFVELLKKHGNSSRFDTFNVPLLYNMMYPGSWFGYNKNELVAVALEHPPTFLGMLTMAIGERGYKDTAIGNLAKTFDKNDLGKQLLHQVWHLPVD